MAGQKTRNRRMTSATVVVLIALTCGCAGNARVELSAADSVEMLGASMTQALAEYHTDLGRLDEERQRAVVQAFIERVRTDIADETATQSHAVEFEEALQRLEADRQAAWERYTASLENVAALQEIAAGLRRLAMDSMSLDDEVKRYFGEVMQRREQTKEQESAKRLMKGERHGEGK